MNINLRSGKEKNVQKSGFVRKSKGKNGLVEKDRAQEVMTKDAEDEETKRRQE